MTVGARRPGAGRLVVHTAFTDRHDGDLCVDLPAGELDARRAVLAPMPWTWLRQVHGAGVVVVDRPGAMAGAEADAAVTAVAGATLAVHTADCAGVLLRGEGDDGEPVAVGAAHAGWRGLELGVLGATVEALQQLGASRVRWRLGPCISPDAYEFGEQDLARLADLLGDEVRSRTAAGRPALDLRAGVAAALARAGAEPELDAPTRVACTATDPGHFSWRARRDRGRQAALTWLAAA